MTAGPKSQQQQRRRLRCGGGGARLFLLALSLLARSPSSAYIQSGLPGHKHRAWLKKMTRDVLDAPVGGLSPETLTAVPQLMAVWAENPYVHSNNGGGGSSWTPTQSSTNRPQHPSSAGPCAHPPSKTENHGLECALEAEALLKRLVDERVFLARRSMAGEEGADDYYAGGPVNVTTEAYNAVLFGWANSGKGELAAERVEQILMQMQRNYEAGDLHVKPDAQSYRAALLACTNCASAERAERLLAYASSMDPSLLTGDLFDAVLRLWSTSGEADAPLRAERLLALMDRTYLAGNDACRLRASSFDEVITAWCRSSVGWKPNSDDNAAQEKEENLMAALAKEAPKRAEAILSHMEQLSHNGEIHDAAPNLATYTSVASAWARSGGQQAAQKAAKVLGRLEKRYKSHPEDPDLRPDTAIYNICIDAWVKAGTKDAFRQARALLDRQLALYDSGNGVRRCMPDVYSYTLVLHACASHAGTMKEKGKAFEVARRTYEELCRLADAAEREGRRGGVRPNQVTYGIMMKACARLLPKGSDERERFATELFEGAKGDGCVGQMVAGRLREAVCPKSYKALMGGATKNSLPSDWTRNVPMADRRQQTKSSASSQKGR